MVFESVVVDLLNRFLGDYVENLNSNQLRVGIWGGDVVLENLSLKPTVLEELDLPLRIASGNLGKLALKIPWKNLYSAPVIVTVERLFLILIPSQEVVYDAEKEEKWAQLAKNSALQKIEEAKKHEAEKDHPKPDDTFVEKLAVQIIKNVQIKIVDIHIRYEDRVTSVDRPFAFGITLHNLSIQTTNSNWEEAFVDQPSTEFFKALFLDGFGIYWNCSTKLIWSSERQDFLEMQKQCKSGIYTKDYVPEGYHYILGPINSTVKLLMNPKPEEVKFTRPKVQIFWDLDNLAIGISKSQYQDLIKLGESLERMSLAAPYRKYRPNLSSYHGNYKAWWKFAFTCILEEDVRRLHNNWNWSKMWKHRNRCRKYAAAYKKKLMSKKPNEETLMLCAESEKYMDVLNIILVRQRVEMEIATLQQATASKKSEGWFGGWWSKGSSSKDDLDALTASAIAKKFESAMTAEEKKKLYQAIDYEENAGKAMYPEAYVELALAFNLPALVLEIRDDVYDNPRILFVELSGVEIMFGRRPAVSGLALNVKMHQFTVFGMQQGEYLPQLVSSKGLAPQGDHLLTILIETNPMDKLCDHRIHIFSRPLEIVYDCGTISKVTDVFRPPEPSIAITQLQAAANSRLQNFKNMSALGLQYAIDNHTTLDLHVDLQSSYLVIPYKGIFLNKEDLIVINLGHISMKSVVRDPGTPNIKALFKQGTSEEDILQRMMAQSYDHFVIRVEDVQVLMAFSGEEWKQLLTVAMPHSPLHILTPTTVVIKLDKCVINNDPRMPKLKVFVNLPSVALHLADLRLLHVLGILTSMQLDDDELLTTEGGSAHTSISISTRADPVFDAKRRDSKPWLKLSEPNRQSKMEVTNVTNVDMQFEMPDFRVSLYRIKRNRFGVYSDLSDSLRVLFFRLMKLEMHLVQTSINMKVTNRLGGVSIDIPDSKQEVRLLDTPMASGEKEYLFSIVYKTETKYAQHTNKPHDEQSVLVTFTKVNVDLHKEALVNLMIYIEEFQEQMEIILNPSTAKPPGYNRLSVVGEADPLYSKTKVKSKSNRKTRVSKSRLNIITFRFQASLDMITLSILNRRKRLTTIALTGCSAEMKFRASRTEIIAKLTDFTVTDLNPVCNHRKVVSVVGNEMILAEVIMYNNSIMRNVPLNAPDISVTADIACLRIVYINAFIASLLHFLSSFQATKQKLLDAAAEAAVVAKQNMKDAQSSKLLIAISFQAPLIVLPINQKSMNAVVLDFGKLGVINTITGITDEDEIDPKAVVDEMTISLEELKISRVKLNKDYSVKNECPLLQPVTFNIDVKRNLSIPSYTVIPDMLVKGKLEELHMSLTEEDFKMLMRVLSENIGYVEEIRPEPVDTVSSTTASSKMTRKNTVSRSQSTVRKQTWEQKQSTKHRKESLAIESSAVLQCKPNVLECDFKMDTFIVDLYNGGVKVLDDEGIRNEAENKNSLGRFSMHNLCVKSFIDASERQVTSFWLINCFLEDTRQTKSGQLTRLMQKKDSIIPVEYEKHMMHIEFSQKNGAKSLDVQVCSFELILSLEYLMRLSSFLSNGLAGEKLSMEESALTVTSAKTTSSRTRSIAKKTESKVLQVNKDKKRSPPQTPESTMFTLTVTLEKPDIILVESMADIDTNCLILNCELAAKIRLLDEHQVINASMMGLQLFSCCYNPLSRDASKALILHPCNMSVAGSTPEGAGLHIDVSFSDIRLGVSPGTIDILSGVYQAIYGSVSQPNTHEEVPVDYMNLWEAEPFEDDDFWFIRTEIGEEVTETEEGSRVVLPELESLAETEGQRESADFEVVGETVVKFEEGIQQSKKEICLVTIPMIVITVEAGIGKQTLPMVKLDMSVHAITRNWSVELEMEHTVSLMMSYYNSRLALWEPLIEPVENRNGIGETSWNMKIAVLSNKRSGKEDMEVSEDSSTPLPLMSISVMSDDNIELTVTKTSIAVITQLAEAFQNAFTEDGWSQKVALKAPFVVRNDTGLPILVHLADSPFVPVNVQEKSSVGKVLLHHGTELGLALKERVEEDAIAWNAKRGSSTSDVTPDMLTPLQAAEMFLNVQVLHNDSILRLAVVRAEKRFFDLQYRGDDNEPWGILSHVQVVAGSSLITLRGILSVKNHFHVPVKVYYMTNKGNELKLVGQIEPNEEINLPLVAIYTYTGELFFSVAEYTVSVKPFSWKTLKTQLVKSELMQCMPKAATERAPFLMQVVGEMEQVYYEHTMKHTMHSTLFNINLRPAVVLRNLLPVDVTVRFEERVRTRLISAGGTIQMPTAEPGISRLMLEILNYMDKDWYCNTPIPWNAPPFTTCTFYARDSYARVPIDLGIHTTKHNGTTTMALYCPFWMLNKTGVTLGYRKSRKIDRVGTAVSSSGGSDQSEDNLNVMTHPLNYSGPVLFSFKAKSFFGKKKAAVCVNNGEFSEKFSLDTAGSSGIVRCISGGHEYQLGVTIQLTHFTLTKLVTFTPYHVLINNSPLVIQVQEADRPADPWTEVQPHNCMALWPWNDKDKELRLRLCGSHSPTATFTYSVVHTTLLEVVGTCGGINVDIHITDSSVYITFSLYAPGLAPALVINHTNWNIKCVEVIPQKGKEKYGEIRTLLAKHKVLMSCQHSVGPKKIAWNLEYETKAFDMRQDGIGEFIVGEGQRLFWVSFLDGVQRVLLLTDDSVVASRAQSSAELEVPDKEILFSFAGLGISLVNNDTLTEVIYVSIASSGIVWETRKSNKKQFKPCSESDSLLIEAAYQKFSNAVAMCDNPSKYPVSRIVINPQLEVDFLDFTTIRPTKQPLRRSHYTGLWVKILTSPHQLQLHAKINRIQIDCQMVDNVFPVVLAPVPPPKSVAVRSMAKPFAELSIVRLISEHSTIQQYKYFKVLIQEFHIKMDIALINALLEIFATKKITEQEEAELFVKDRSTIKKPLLEHVSLKAYEEKQNFYDFLHFSPLKIHLSFSLSAGSQKGKQEIPVFLNVLMQSLGVTLTDVQDVIFKLGYFQREHTFLSQNQLISEATSHFVGQAVKQLYVLVLGLDVLGNPYGLVLGLTQGVEDLFYEPFQGAIQGPGEFAEGLVLGVRSLLGHTVGGAAGAASRITGAMGKGLAALTFDKDYQQKRREAMNQRHTNLQAGLAQSSKGLVMGVVDGVSGVFTKPISGAREDGMTGFLAGMGKGMMGLVTRPTAGVIDFASGSLDAVKRVADLNEEVTRRRLPRFFNIDGLIRPYSATASRGNKILQSVEKGRFVATDIYVFHVACGKDTFMLTNKRVMYITHGDMFGSSVSWSYTWESLKLMPRLTEEGIFIMPPVEEKRILGIFGSSEAEAKFVSIPDALARERIMREIGNLMKKG